MRKRAITILDCFDIYAGLTMAARGEGVGEGRGINTT